MEEQDGLDMLDLERSAGWQTLLRYINEEIQTEYRKQKDIDLSGTLQEIATEYITITKKIEGMERVLSLVEEIKHRRERLIK